MTARIDEIKARLAAAIESRARSDEAYRVYSAAVDAHAARDASVPARIWDDALAAVQRADRADDALFAHAPTDLALLVEAVDRFAAFAGHATANAPVIDRAEAELAWLPHPPPTPPPPPHAAAAPWTRMLRGSRP